MFSSMRSSFHMAWAGAEASRRSRSAYTKARSPTRMATPSPKRRASPSQPPDSWPSAKVRWVVRTPRRVAEPSITSSWNRAKAWSSSKAAPASTDRGSSGSPPAPTKPQWQKAGRRRLPPDSTSDCSDA